MSLKSRLISKRETLLDAARSAAADANLQGSGLTSKETVNNLLSMESLDSVNRANLGAAVAGAQRVIENAFGDQISVENFTSPFGGSVAEAQRLRDVALESGAIALLASASPVDYARAALSLESQAPAGGSLVTLPADGAAGSLGFGYSVSNEAYDETELHKFQAYSLAFNTMAARQDDFGEGFYPTIVISADQAGADLVVRRQRVFDEVRHALTGKATDFGFKNLLSAAIDPTILADESTRLVPYRDPTVAAPANQLNTDQFGQKSVVVAGVDVPTAPYKFGKEINLIGISGFPALIGAGILDQTDAVAPRASVSTVYLSGGVDGGSGDDLPVVGFNTTGLFRSSFVASTEGRDKEMTLMFKFSDMVIDKNTKSIAGAAVPDFAAIVSGDLTVHCSVTISGTLDLQFGNVALNSSSVSVNKITDNTGAAISLTTGTGATVKAAVEALPMVGFDLQSYRTNSNRRTAGKRLDVETIRERYTVLVQPPLTVQRPAGADGEAAELEALVNAARLRNSNNAVTALLNQAAILKSVVRGPGSAIAEIAGLGRLLVNPYYEEVTLDLLQSLNSIKAHERAEDISATLIQAIRDQLYRMYQHSGIQAALDAQNPSGNETPVVLIGTDQTIVRHLMVSGDTRTFGTQFPEARVVVSSDSRIRGKIFLTFTRSKNLDQLDALRFGSHLWMPELVSRMPVNRNGATNMEAMVQTRNLQVSHLPVLAQIKVINMPAALVDKTLQPAIADNLDNPYLDDILFI